MDKWVNLWMNLYLTLRSVTCLGIGPGRAGGAGTRAGLDRPGPARPGPARPTPSSPHASAPHP